MAGELTRTISWTYAKGLVGPFSLGVTAKSIDVAGNNGVIDFVQLSTSIIALSLGAITGALGEYYFKNCDPTNTLTIKSSTTGIAIITLGPGKDAAGYFGADVTAPAAVAAAGTPVLQYAILPP